MSGERGPLVTRARAFALAANVLLAAFLVCLALVTVAEVHHGQATGTTPHDRPVALPGQVLKK